MTSEKTCLTALVYVIFAALMPAGVLGQEEDGLPDLDELKVPESPVFTLMGIAPTEVSRPTTPKDFAFSLLESTGGDTDGLPQNAAFEFSPYWWTDRKLTFKDYYFDRRYDIGMNIVESLSISTATADFSTEIDGEDFEGTRAGLGFRFNILRGRPSNEFISAAADVFAYQLAINKLVTDAALPDEQLADLIREREVLPSDPTFDVERKRLTEQIDAKTIEIEQKYQQNLAIREQLAERIAPLITRMDESDAKKFGWELQLGSAAAFDFEDNDFDDAEFSRAGIWITAAYTPGGYRGAWDEKLGDSAINNRADQIKADALEGVTKNGGNADNALNEIEEESIATSQERIAEQFTFLASLRFIQDEALDAGSKLDVGGRIIWQHQKVPIQFSAEYLRRFFNEEDDRIVAVVEYAITDNYSIFASYGKTFDDEFFGNENLVAVLGARLGWGKGPIWDRENEREN